jgi:hypothetical protein
VDKQKIPLDVIEVNLSPEAFHLWAEHYYKCKQDFEPPHGFSPVPYFLLCRALELEIKSRHLKSQTQRAVKYEFGHHLIHAYECLSEADKVLTSDELSVLRCANEIYMSKGFEYFKPGDALSGYSACPDLDELDAIASKLIGCTA